MVTYRQGRLKKACTTVQFRLDLSNPRPATCTVMKKRRVRRPVAEWQHLIAHYDDLPRDQKRPWLKSSGISVSTLANKKAQLKKKGLKPVKSAHPLTRQTEARTKLFKKTPKPLVIAAAAVTEELEFLRYLLRRARKQGFLAEILSVDGE